MTKLKKLDVTIMYNVKHASLLILKISFLTLFGCGVKITLDINPKYGILDCPCSKGRVQKKKKVIFIT